METNSLSEKCIKTLALLLKVGDINSNVTIAKQINNQIDQTTIYNLYLDAVCESIGRNILGSNITYRIILIGCKDFVITGQKSDNVMGNQILTTHWDYIKQMDGVKIILENNSGIIPFKKEWNILKP